MFYRHRLQYIFPPAGVSFLCPVHSWTTGEEMAKDILQHRYVLKFDFITMYLEELEDTLFCIALFFVCRGVLEGRRGWSVLLKEAAQWVELEGSDYVLDLMSDLELPADFPKRSSYFIISAQEPTRVRPNASM